MIDYLSTESLVLGKLACHLCLQSTLKKKKIYIYIYIYVGVCVWYVQDTFVVAGPVLRNVDGVKCQPLL